MIFEGLSAVSLTDAREVFAHAAETQQTAGRHDDDSSRAGEKNKNDKTVTVDAAAVEGYGDLHIEMRT